jgi:N-glycosylase/DNA lyase
MGNHIKLMETLVEKVRALSESDVGRTVKSRIMEFEEAGRKLDEDVFGELCFCILTANFNAERSIRIQDDVRNGFCTFSASELASRFKKLGHRFPDARAKYIVEARRHTSGLKERLGSFKDERELRAWLADNVKGLGYKEASHFLRNIGYKNVAIVDFHIIDLLVRYGLIEKPKTLTKKRYLEIEGTLQKIADRLGMSLAELDLYLWYMETGKVLK